MLSKKQKVIYSILIMFVVVVYVFSNYIIDFDKDKKTKTATVSTPKPTIEIETDKPEITKSLDYEWDEMDMSIKGHANYEIPIEVKADKCSLIYKMVNAKIENDKLSFVVNIEKSKDLEKVIVSAKDEMDNILEIDVQDNDNKLNCTVNGVKSEDVFIKVYILTKEQYTDYLGKKSKLEEFKFGVNSVNIKMLKRMGE